MDQHPAVANLQGDLAMAALHNPHQPGTPESEKYHGLLNEAAQPQNMHKYLGCGMEELVSRATKASLKGGTDTVVEQSHDERLYDQPVTAARY